jgi:CheY-like chemotaxis protein
MLDLNMPKKNGKEVLSEIKQHPLFKRIPVIVYTTTKSELEVRRCYELGANTYIVKPISFDSLLNVVQSIRNYWLSTASIPILH